MELIRAAFIRNRLSDPDACVGRAGAASSPYPQLDQEGQV
jgi:hypothetical protein